MALCRLSFLVLLKSTIYPVFYYSRNSTVTGIVEYLIPRMELLGRLPRYMVSGPCRQHLWLYIQLSQDAHIPPTSQLPPLGVGITLPLSLSIPWASKVCCFSHHCLSYHPFNIETGSLKWKERKPQRIYVANRNLGLPVWMSWFCGAIGCSLYFLSLCIPSCRQVWKNSVSPFPAAAPVAPSMYYTPAWE